MSSFTMCFLYHNPVMQCRFLLCMYDLSDITYVTLEHKSSLKSLGCICSKSQKYIVWVKIIDFSFMPKII